MIYFTAESTNELRQYILGEILKTPDDVLEEDKDLLLSGLLDSISVMRLVTHIEEQAGISIPPEDLLPEHFGTLKQIDDCLKGQHS